MRRGNRDHRIVTVLFTDIVGSSRVAAELGDRRWRVLLARHHEIVRKELKRFGGRELDTAGDGFYALFARPSDAVRCACAVSDTVRELGIDLRAGLNLGEAEVIGRKPGGMTVHAAARIMALAGPNEVFVSSTLKEFVPGSGFTFADRGEHVLRDVPGRWRLFAVTELDGRARGEALPSEEAAKRLAAIAPPPLIQRPIGRVLVGAAALILATTAVIVPIVTRKPPPAKPPAIVPNSLVRIDPSTGRVMSVIPLGAATGGQMTVVQGRIWLMGGNGLVWIVDPATNRARSFGGSALFGAGIAYGYGWVWVSGSSSTISRLDPATFPASGAVDRTIQLPSAFGAVVAIDEATRWPDGHGMVWTNVNLNRGPGPLVRDEAVGIDTETISVRERIRTGHGTNGIAVGEGAVWISNYEDSTVSKFVPKTGSYSTIPVAAGPGGITVAFGSVWVIDPASGMVSKIDPATDLDVKDIHVGRGSTRVDSSISAGAGRISAATPDGVVMIDPSTYHVKSIPLPFVAGAPVFADGSAWVLLGEIPSTQIR